MLTGPQEELRTSPAGGQAKQEAAFLLVTALQRPLLCKQGNNHPKGTVSSGAAFEGSRCCTLLLYSGSNWFELCA
jgi:hypothetical protein